MKVSTHIQVESHDLTNLKHIEEAHSLLGGDGWLDEIGVSHDKVFARIRGNDFMSKDVDQAISILQRRYAEIIANAKDRSKCSRIFANGERGWAMWRDGVIANADLALRQADIFRENLMLDYMQHMEKRGIGNASLVKAARIASEAASALPLKQRNAVKLIATEVENQALSMLDGF